MLPAQFGHETQLVRLIKIAVFIINL